MELEVLKTDGKGSGEKVKLPKDVFGAKPNEHVVYLAVKASSANKRQGTASTKTRSMVRGGGKKPWRQKGRGVARAGTTRSPIWVGGGRVFGPHPRDYSMRLPKKMKRLARVSVLSDKAGNKQIKLVEDFKVESGKTRDMVAILRSLGLDGRKTLLLLPEYDSLTLRAARNIPRLQVRVAETASTYDLLDCEWLVMQKGAVKKLKEVLTK
ncbi:MAG: 50S ribosomal protein L4 [Calditrichaeota bacterium]|nr:MAG: 50S ribosomal protein L4 [Calditrichota bacterium]